MEKGLKTSWRLFSLGKKKKRKKETWLLILEIPLKGFWLLQLMPTVDGCLCGCSALAALLQESSAAAGLRLGQPLVPAPREWPGRVCW